jgi:hypothetical protein
MKRVEDLLEKLCVVMSGGIQRGRGIQRGSGVSAIDQRPRSHPHREKTPDPVESPVERAIGWMLPDFTS